MDIKRLLIPSSTIYILPVICNKPCENEMYQLGSAELISSHRQRVADVGPHSDDNDEKPPDFGQDKTKFGSLAKACG